jgi:hypothetical protein
MGLKCSPDIAQAIMEKGLTKCTLCGIVLFKLNTFFNHVFSGP